MTPLPLPARTVSLFIVRIVQEPDSGQTTDARFPWRGLVRHLQSGREQHFRDLRDMVTFIAEFLPAGEPTAWSEGGRK